MKITFDKSAFRQGSFEELRLTKNPSSVEERMQLAYLWSLRVFGMDPYKRHEIDKTAFAMGKRG